MLSNFPIPSEAKQHGLVIIPGCHSHIDSGKLSWAEICCFSKIIMYVLGIILPCYNESSSIVGIIWCIISALQGRNDVEIILVDNGTTDSSPQVLERALQGETI
jgi:hypothetical protein